MPRSLVDTLTQLSRRIRPQTGASAWGALTGLQQSSSRILLGTREIELQPVRRGWKGEQCGETQQFVCPPVAPEDPAWRGALSALDAHAGSAPLADVVLSNELVRYAVVPWIDGMNDGDVQQAYVRHHFAQNQVSATELWTLRYTEQNWGMPYPAAAMETALLDSLRASLETHAVRTRSIQPLFSWAYNRWCAQFEGTSYWFVSTEPRRLVVGRFADGNWESVHSHRIVRDWTLELPLLLTRARLQSPSAAAGGRVYVATPGLEGQLVVGDWLATGLRLPLSGLVADALVANVQVAG